jgi:hypothetical protein
VDRDADRVEHILAPEIIEELEFTLAREAPDLLERELPRRPGTLRIRPT